MSFIDDALAPVKIPRFVRIRQNFERPKVENPAKELIRLLEEGKYLDGVKPGMKIAITAGSRGITNYPLLVRTLCGEVKKRGGEPFVFPSMGSHGGATAEGQRSMLEGLGITEETMGCPIYSSMDAVQIGVSGNGCPVCIDKYADEADGIIVINRIKPHTGFRGKVESGLCKMIAIGMGKQKGASFCHAAGFGHMAENIPSIARFVLENKPVLCCVGLLENAFHDTAEIHTLRAGEVLEKEPALLKRAWELLATIQFPQFDTLIMDEIGKNVSGTGFDTNVVGRYNSPYASGGPDIAYAAALDLTDVSHGNANGAGMLDAVSFRIEEKFDKDNTYPNSITSTVPLTVKLPMVMKNDRQVFQVCIKMRSVRGDNQRIVRIKNTLSLNEIEI